MAPTAGQVKVSQCLSVCESVQLKVFFNLSFWLKTTSSQSQSVSQSQSGFTLSEPKILCLVLINLKSGTPYDA